MEKEIYVCNIQIPLVLAEVCWSILISCMTSLKYSVDNLIMRGEYAEGTLSLLRVVK